MKDVVKHVNGQFLTSYADDTYVLITGADKDDIVDKLTDSLDMHLHYLKKQGMVTNLSKTEAVLFSRRKNLTNFPVTIDGESFNTQRTMKVLGVIFDENLSWSQQVESVVKKSRKLNNAMTIIRRKLTFKQFMQVLTSQYYGLCYYGCSVWLNGLNSFKDLRMINAVHYRSLRIAVKDYKRRISRSTLDDIGRARPTTWAKYCTSSIIIKALTRKEPCRMVTQIGNNMYIERRRPLRPKSFSKCDLRIGMQSIVNRACNYINDIDFDWANGIADDALRTNLKRLLQMR